MALFAASVPRTAGRERASLINEEDSVICLPGLESRTECQSIPEGWDFGSRTSTDSDPDSNIRAESATNPTTASAQRKCVF